MLKWLSTQFGKKQTTQEQAVQNESSAEFASSENQNHADWRKRGNAFLNQQKLEDAAACYRQGINQNPHDVPCLVNLAFVLTELQQTVEAKSLLTQALDIDPQNADALFSLGNFSHEEGNTFDAISLFRRALQEKSHFPFCRLTLCNLLMQSGRPLEAQAVFEEGETHELDSADFYFLKANIHFHAEELEDALQSFIEAEKRKPKDATILLHIGVTHLRLKNITDAFKTFYAILAFSPKHPMAIANLAAAYQLSGNNERSIAYYREALSINPNNLSAHQNLLFALSYLPECKPEDYLIEARAYGAKIAHLAEPFTNWQSSFHEQTDRPLRVGFVSGDLRGHPVGLFLGHSLSKVDRNKLTCIAYSNNAVEDQISARLKSLFSEWFCVHQLNDKELATKIHEDKIDILIDLAGHTERNRLAVFAWKPSPVQIAWLGYWASTGVKEIDYILLDEYSVPKSEIDHYSETPFYLPNTRLCLSPPITTRPIEVNDLPAISQGYVTFGSFQTLIKINHQTLQLWSQVLTALPHARLRIQNASMDYPDAVKQLRERMAIANIDVQRVIFVGAMSYTDYLAVYNEIDFILDTTPFPGGTTTAEAIWMGVPTLTLKGNSLLSRQGESMLSCVGLQDWVASSEQDFVHLAIAKTNGLEQLAKTRRTLRESALSSPLFNATHFAKNFEEALITIWKNSAKINHIA